MAIYQTRNCIRAAQWDPENKQKSLENIKELVNSNPNLGWRVSDNIICDSVEIYNECLPVLRIRPYNYLVEGKKDSLFTVPPETFELFYELESGTAYARN